MAGTSMTTPNEHAMMKVEGQARALRIACEEWLANPQNEIDLNDHTNKPYRFQIESLHDFVLQREREARQAVWEEAAKYLDKEAERFDHIDDGETHMIRSFGTWCRAQAEKETL